MKRIVILGANGFIGRQLSEGLARQEKYRLSLAGRTLDSGYFARICPHDDLIEADFSDTARMVNLCRTADIVIDLINATPPRDNMGAVAADMADNLLPHVDFLEQMAEKSAARIVFFSSGGTVYGNAPKLPIQEDSPARPISPYGVSKLTLERYLHLFHATRGLKYSVLRVGNIYGPDQPVKRGQGVIPALLEAVFEDRKFTLFGQGRSQRDYVYSDDVTEVVKRLIETPESNAMTFNIGSGKGHSVQDIIQAFRHWSGRAPQIEHKDSAAEEVGDVILDIKRAKNTLGWRPETSFSDGLARTFEHFAARYAAKTPPKKT